MEEKEINGEKKGKNGENTYTLNENILLPIILG